ncbi:MAG: hypothetical protein CME40_09195 [Haliea sp.]|nr:hypothetical protein [Haliea sp.]
MRRLKSILKRISDRGRCGFNIPVLCYHSWTVDGDVYGANDHVCLEQDLHTLAARGYQVLPAECLVDLLEEKIPSKAIAGKKLVCLTFDDGRDYDYFPHVDERWGEVKGFHSIVSDSVKYLPQLLPGTRAVSFVIASPAARRQLDEACGRGQGEWNDFWWEDCAREGVLGIANHSWDHVHDALPEVRQKDNAKGSFFRIDSFEDAERQIADAQQYIDEKTNGLTIPVFCYPYGHVPEYLKNTYFPENADRIGLRAAFSTAGASVTPHSDRWALPRFVCGLDWKTGEEFERLLSSCEAGTL